MVLLLILLKLMLLLIRLKLKENITGETGNNGTKNFEIIVALKYLSNFSKILEMLLINCEILILI